MTIDVYTATGTKKGTTSLPKGIFGVQVNEDLMHQSVVRQQSNARHSIAHAKSRGEVQGSTRKLFAQKGTGRARRGSVRSPLLRGGGKAFGPNSNANFEKNMPRKMRRGALRSCLSVQASNGVIVGLEGYPEDMKTKAFFALLQKLPVDIGRKILFVLPESHRALSLSARNIPGVHVVQAAYLNPVDVLGAKHIVFLVDAIAKVEEIFGAEEKKEASTSAKATVDKKETPKKEVKDSKEAKEKKSVAKKSAAKKLAAKKPTKKEDTDSKPKS